jgi:uncharacterized protein
MKVEIRNNSVVLDGYVNVPQKDSRVLPSPRGKFVEQIMSKVFQRALDRTDNVDVLFNHKNDRKLGSIKDGNLQIYEDNVGLRAIATITDEEVISLAKSDSLKGWSFGFVANKDRWEDSGGIQRRYIEDLDLLEISVLSVTPAYYATSIEARGDEMVVAEQRFDTFDSRGFVNKEDESKEDPKEEETETEQEELVEESQEPPDYTLIEKIIEYLKFGGIK